MSDKYLTIIDKDKPCWYQLDWQDNPPIITLGIHRDFMKESKIRGYNLVVENCKKDFAHFLKSFTNLPESLEKGFLGFDSCFFHNLSTVQPSGKLPGFQTSILSSNILI